MANKILMGLIIGLLVGLIVGGTVSYLIFNGQRGSRGNFNNVQLNETQINEITSFFNSNPTSEEINSYCNQNGMSCMYYCKNINPNHEICTTINFQPGNLPTQGGQ